ncbi:MAG: hypothetical protein HRT37_20305 [Alteromonadaceae bacterium]|nr:hypothetical protein [Alteromonadaceae bacterium]
MESMMDDNACNKKIQIILTTNWPVASEEELVAKNLHSIAVTGEKNKETTYQLSIEKQLQERDSNTIYQLDELLRKRIDGFDDIQKLTGAMLGAAKPINVIFEINIFAYAYLKYVKNYDIFMSPTQNCLVDIEPEIKKWKSIVKALEDFERLGQDLSQELAYLKVPYLKLRAIVARSTARDEQRALAVLFISGPSNSKDIGLDLGLNYSLNKRIMTAMVTTGTISDNRINSQGEIVYALKDETIPIVMFLVREIIGLDLISMIENIGGAN